MNTKAIPRLCILVLLLILSLTVEGAAASPKFQPPAVAEAAPSVEKGYLSVPAAAFLPADSTNNFENHGRYIKNLGPDTLEYYRASVQLPHGATVTRFSFCFYEDSPSASAQVYLYEGDSDNSNDKTLMAFINSQLESGFSLVSEDTIIDPLVENLSKVYWISLFLPISTGAGNDVWGCGAFIEYTKPAVASGILSMSGAPFKPREDGYNDDNQQSDGVLIHTSDSSGSDNHGGYLAQVELPHGAVVNEMRFYYNDQSVSDSIGLWLQRSNHTGTYWDMASVSSLDGASTNTTTTISNATIDNYNYAYWVFISLPKFLPGVFKFYSVKIYYSLPTVDTGVLALSNAAFSGFYDSFDFENHARWLYHRHGEGGSSARGVYLAPVYLPDRATIKTLWVAVYDGSESNSISAYLVRTRLGVNEIIAETTSTGSSGYIINNHTWLGNNAVVDNSQYAYYVYWDLPASALNVPPQPNDVIPCTVYIDYDYNYFIHLPVVLR